MSKRLTSGLVAAIAAVSMSIPAVGLASKGGVSRSPRACPTHKHSGKHKGATKRGLKRGANHGKKCGWGGTGQTGTTNSTSTTGSNGKGKDNGATHGLKRGHRS
jgi:hypothetical protein